MLTGDALPESPAVLIHHLAAAQGQALSPVLLPKQKQRWLVGCLAQRVALLKMTILEPFSLTYCDDAVLLCSTWHYFPQRYAEDKLYTRSYPRGDMQVLQSAKQFSARRIILSDLCLASRDGSLGLSLYQSADDEVLQPSLHQDGGQPVRLCQGC